jgi:murein L,D-transpeptidase YcbB/YkuD
LCALAFGGDSVALANDTPPVPDTPLAQLLTQNNAPFDGYALNKIELLQLYQTRSFYPVWDTQSATGREAIAAFLESMKAYAAYHGLDEKHFAFPLIAPLLDKPDDAAARLKLEVLMTDSLFKLAHRIHGDGVTLAYLYAGWPFTRPAPSYVAEIAAAIKDNKLNEYFTAQAPSDLDYTRLAATLKDYRAMRAKGAWPLVTQGDTIRLGDKSPRLASIRARLEAEDYAVPMLAEGVDPLLYTQELMAVVIDYQVRHGLDADGNIGAKTIAAMNVPLDERIGQIIANMERKRHMAQVFPVRYAIVNIANTTVQIIENGQRVYYAPVITGRTIRKTPFIQSVIRSVIFNPSWHVPAKIAREDILPKLQKDPHYLEKMGFVINGSADDPHGDAIDWNEISKSEFNFRLRQAPGELNSLGRIKFDFDNDFSVYMHGTPHEELFAKADRHLSSGCVRLQDPVAFAVFVLSDNEGDWTPETVQAEIDKAHTHWLKVANPLPLFIVYETVYFPTAESAPHFAPDVYNYDRILLDALGKMER